jgi:hypothetical protein
MTDALITAVRFEDAHGRRVVHATFDDGRSDELFAFFADEILFCEGDLVGKTEAQARELYYRRDRDYLQS